MTAWWSPNPSVTHFRPPRDARASAFASTQTKRYRFLTPPPNHKRASLSSFSPSDFPSALSRKSSSHKIFPSLNNYYTHTHTYTHVYIYIYIYGSEEACESGVREAVERGFEQHGLIIAGDVSCAPELAAGAHWLLHCQAHPKRRR